MSDISVTFYEGEVLITRLTKLDPFLLQNRQVNFVRSVINYNLIFFAVSLLKTINTYVSYTELCEIKEKN